MRVSKSALDEIKRAFETYCSEVEKSGLRPASKSTYLLHAENFVRWLADDFKPGSTLSLSGRRARST